MNQGEMFERVLASIHGAALDGALWPVASGHIDEACGMRGNTVVVARGHSQRDGEILFARTCHHGERHEDWEQTYFEDYYPLDERVPRVTGLPDSRLVHVADLFSEQERKTSATYNESLPVAGYQNGLNVRLNGPEGSSIFWALADSTKRGGWGSRQIAMIESLLPHLRHFIFVHHALGGSYALNNSLSRLLDNTRLGVIQLDRRGCVIGANDRARSLLREGYGLFVQDGFLGARAPADDRHLQGLLAAALPRFGLQATGGSMTVFRWPLGTQQEVRVLPVGDDQRDFGMGRVTVLVLVTEPGRPPQLDPKLVASALGLTKTESQVAVALAMGQTPSDIAKRRGRKVTTVRFHVKQTYAKLGLSRQADLIRLVLSLGDAQAPSPATRAGLP